MKRFTFALSILVLSIFSTLPANSEIFYSESYGYYMDLPEGYKLKEQAPDESSLYFSHSFLPVNFAIKIYDSKTGNAEQILKSTLSKLNAKNDFSTIKWNNLECAIANFSFNLANSQNTGYAVSIPVGQGKACAVLMCYCPAQKYVQFSPAVLSTINSFMPDKKGFTQSGIITSFAYPETSRKEISLKVSGKNIKTFIDSEDAQAADFVVNYEYTLLTWYADSPLWKEAWQRYYRMIYKDSYSRLKQVSQSLYKEIFPVAAKKDSENPEKAYMQELLSWTQNFEYRRDHSKTDFTDLISAITAKGSDCDSRSLLLCIIAKHAGIDSALFISREYSHAIAGFNLEGQGARISIGDTAFLLGETTAKNVALGLISQDMADTNKWIPVELP